MRLVIQRVKSAKVSVDGRIVGEIGRGIFILLGVGKTDNLAQVSAMAEKCVNLRIMADEDRKMNLSIMDLRSIEATGGELSRSAIKDIEGKVLVVSQFTLYSNTTDGRRPSFLDAAEPELAKSIYEKFVEELKAKGLKVETGSFGNYMEINADLDGPVTIILEN